MSLRITNPTRAEALASASRKISEAIVHELNVIKARLVAEDYPPEAIAEGMRIMSQHAAATKLTAMSQIERILDERGVA